MLLNTVIICINQCLPITLLWVLLQHNANYEKPNVHYAIPSVWVVMIGLVLSMVYLSVAGMISQWFDYTGSEMTQMLLFILLYLSLLISLIKPMSYFPPIALVLAMVIYFSNFLTYLVGFASQDAFQALFIGTILGIGICLSFSVLLYFFLANAVVKRFSFLFIGLFALHAGSKMTVMSDLGAQIDLLPTTASLYDAKLFIDEHSVFGRLLKVLMGYESNPSGLSFVVYVCSVGVCLLVAHRAKKINNRSEM